MHLICNCKYLAISTMPFQPVILIWVDYAYRKTIFRVPLTIIRRHSKFVKLLCLLRITT